MNITRQQAAKKRNIQAIQDNNILESLHSVGSSIGQAVTKDVMGKVGADIIGSLAGQTPRSGELKPNQDVEIAPAGKEKTKAKIQTKELISDQLIHAEKQQTLRAIESIRQELKNLVESLKGLHIEVQKAVEQAPVDGGVYHLNFFEQLKSFLMALRQQIEDSRSWLEMTNSRKRKMGYWGMFKKHGTQFGLSSERSIAMSAG